MLGRLLGLFSVPSLGCALWALSNDRYQQASLFVLVMMMGVVVSAVLLIATNAKNQKAGLQETVTFLLSAWFSLAVFGAVPFLLRGDGSFVLALFEAVSCLTTTGSTLLDDGTPLSSSLLFWRGILHLTGASLTITGTLILLALSGKNTVGIQHTQARHIGISLRFSSFLNLFGLVCLSLIGLVILTVIVLVLNDLSLREAFSLSVGAATTGELLPYESGALVAESWIGVLLSVILLMASLNMGLLLSSVRSPKLLWRDMETVGIVAFFLLLLIILFLFENGSGVFLSITEAASIVSTSGLMIPDHRQVEIDIPVLIFFGFLGGSAISATGGIKIFRMRILLAQAAHEFGRLSHPNSVLKFDFDGSKDHVRAMVSVWVYLIGFAGVAALLASYLSLLGLDFNNSMLVSVGAITNSAALFRTELLDGYHGGLTQMILTFSMLFGRLELLLLFSLVIRTR